MMTVDQWARDSPQFEKGAEDGTGGDSSSDSENGVTRKTYEHVFTMSVKKKNGKINVN